MVGPRDAFANSGVASPHPKVEVPPQWLSSGRTSDFFEAIYAGADGDEHRVPWADLSANPLLVDWLNASACCAVRPGARTIVVGAGLGDDVLELYRRGYDVMGFDIAPTAVRWAQRRLPEIADRLVTADLLSPPSRWLRRFDLVVEIYTVQSLPPARRPEVCRALGSLLTPRGVLLVIARRRDAAEALDEGAAPPWPLTPGEIATLMEDAGLAPATQPLCTSDDEQLPRYVGVFCRP